MIEREISLNSITTSMVNGTRYPIHYSLKFVNAI